MKAFLFILVTTFSLSCLGDGDLYYVKKGTTPLPNAKPQMTKESCSKIDLSPKMGPIRHQIASSCYAYTATDLINFNRKEIYSAMYLASNYQGKSGGGFSSDDPVMKINGLDGGNVKEAIIQGLNRGMCPESAVASLNSDETGIYGYKAILEFYEEAKKAGCYQGQDMELLVRLAEAQKISNASRALYNTWFSFRDVVKEYFPGIKTNDLQRITENVEPENLIQKIALAACKGKIQIPKIGDHVEQKTIMRMCGNKKCFQEDLRKVIFEHINSTLEKKRPIGINYLPIGLLLQEVKSTNTQHSGSVAGRKWVEEQKDVAGKVITLAGCYYLVKNSWGEDWEVPKDVKARNVEGKPGYFMMSEQALMEHVYETTSID